MLRRILTSPDLVARVGIAPWPYRNAYQPEATALVILAFGFVVAFSGVTVMSSAYEKLVGAYSLPSSIKSQLRFSEDQDGKLILRIYDFADGDWRDAKVSDLSPVEVDLMARRDRARFRANTRGSGIGTRTALAQDDRRGKATFVHAGETPRDRSVTVLMKANFFVTDGIKYTVDAPLFDEEAERRDPLGEMFARMQRTRDLMKMVRV